MAGRFTIGTENLRRRLFFHLAGPVCDRSAAGRLEERPAPPWSRRSAGGGRREAGPVPGPFRGKRHAPDHDPEHSHPQPAGGVPRQPLPAGHRDGHHLTPAEALRRDHRLHRRQHLHHRRLPAAGDGAGDAKIPDEQRDTFCDLQQRPDQYLRLPQFLRPAPRRRPRFLRPDRPEKRQDLPRLLGDRRGVGRSRDPRLR